MGTINKRHNRHIERRCPVCGGKVIVANRSVWWWVACESRTFPNHIPQVFYGTAKEAIDAWNERKGEEE